MELTAVNFNLSYPYKEMYNLIFIVSVTSIKDRQSHLTYSSIPQLLKFVVNEILE